MKEKYREWFQIGSLAFEVEANFSLCEWLWEPQPYNLWINYMLTDISQPIKIFHIWLLNELQKEVTVNCSDKNLEVMGDFSCMEEAGYNQQFGLFGNKGILNQYLLHTIEVELGATIFHGCSVRNPLDGRVLIGIGASGSGKSTFISCAVQQGWELLSTEYTIIDTQLRLWNANHYDNVSPVTAEYIEKDLKEAVVYKNKRLMSPLGQKIFVDMRRYANTDLGHPIVPSSVGIVLLDFGNQKIKKQPLEDRDFFLRILQIFGSEKINSPIIFSNQIYEAPLHGNPVIRSEIIQKIIENCNCKYILGGIQDDFEQYLRFEYR